jgi:hypothetical protein
MVARLVAKWPEIAEKSKMSFERQREILDTELRAACFSDHSRVALLDEILLWSHYANKHKGIRIGFEFPEGIKEPFEIFPMVYQKDRVKVNLSFWEDIEIVNRALEECAKTKSESWQYEHEFRLLTKTFNCEPREFKNPDSIEHFLQFNREWVKSVDFGVLCPEPEIQRVVGLLKTDYPKVITRKAQFHKTEYALEYIKVQ